MWWVFLQDPVAEGFVGFKGTLQLLICLIDEHSSDQ
jgi:hypothetical protein